MKCALCQVYSEQPELRRDPTDPNYAFCPRCKTRIPNFDGAIKFRGRPPGAKNVAKEEKTDG